MEVFQIGIDKIKPYRNNPRNNRDAVRDVAESIKQFGFKVPLVLDGNYEIVTGHTRFEASKKLGLKTVPCVIADDLTPEQVKAFRLVDNKVSEKATWNDERLIKELSELTIDMSVFDFDFLSEDDFADLLSKQDKKKKKAGGADPAEDPDATEDEITGGLLKEKEKQAGDDPESQELPEPKTRVNYQVRAQNLRENILNLGKAHFDGVGFYDIPEILPVYDLPKIKEWIPFNYVLSDTEPEGKGVHFFIDDYQFERIWNNPDPYMEKLKKYACVTAPDFSPFTDMPFSLQVFNHYRKHWCARYMQENGLTVIPTIRTNTDFRFQDLFLDGTPTGAIICFSSMWVSCKESEFMKDYKKVIEKLKPKKIYIYGNEIKNIPEGVEVEYIKSFSRTRFDE